MAEFSSFNGYTVKDAVARNIAKGRNQAVAFNDYATMIEALNKTEKDEYKTGQNIYIGIVGVPDLWVYSVENIVHNFTYTSDEDIVEMLKNNTTIQVGYYKLAMLEGQKVDLTTYDEKLAEHTENITEHTNNIAGINANIEAMKTSFQGGCNAVYSAVRNKGVTPTSKSLNDIVVAINNIKTSFTHTLRLDISLYSSSNYPSAYINIVDETTGQTVCTYSNTWYSDSSGNSISGTGRNTNGVSTRFTVS